MSDHTGIEWTDATWNPIRGCSLVSKGCENCYAMGVAARFSGPGMAYEGLARRRSNGKAQWTGEVRVVGSHITDPLSWRTPRRIFVNSMSDLFHETLPFETIAALFAVMSLARQHTFQVLTKRPERMLEFFRWVDAEGVRLRDMPQHDPWDGANVVTHHAAVVLDQYPDRQYERLERALGAVCDDFPPDWPLPNVWLGVSTENQATADERIPLLRRTPAAVRFLSCEPLLGVIDIQSHLASGELHWVIAGGESGHDARPMHPLWPRWLADQCVANRVPYFFKQWGEYRAVCNIHDDNLDWLLNECDDDALTVVDTGGVEWVNNDMRCDGQPPSASYFVERVGKKRAGRELDGRIWDEFPAAWTEAHPV